jgi:hypothetical protein
MGEMPDYLKRVVEERDQLHERLVKLRAFLNSTAFTQIADDEQRRLNLQAMYMTDYERVLNERLGAAASA